MEYDVIIVGAGSMGMAAGYELAKQGRRTLLLDAFNPPHDRGSHHGDTRIIRHAYGEGESYVPLALRAQELWLELEKRTGRTLFHPTGVLNVGNRDSTFIQQVLSSSKTYGLPVEVLDTDEVHQRWPGISLPDDYLGCFESASGVLNSEECLRAYRELIESLADATIVTNAPVKDITLRPDGVTVYTNDHAFNAQSLIVTGGAWSAELLSFMNITLPLVTLRKTFAWFDTDERLFDSSRFPAFTFETATGHYYGFPGIDGSGLKVGRHDGGQRMDPNDALPRFGAFREDEEDVRSFLRQSMPPASDSRLKMGKTCTYTLTPDEHFIIDIHPEYPHVAFAAGFSGHGFKFSSVVGEILSQLITTHSSKYDISLFSMNRF